MNKLPRTLFQLSALSLAVGLLSSGFMVWWISITVEDPVRREVLGNATAVSLCIFGATSFFLAIFALEVDYQEGLDQHHGGTPWELSIRERKTVTIDSYGRRDSQKI